MATTITNIAGLQAMKDNLSEDYVLGNDIDASETRSWNEIPGAPGTYYGFEPVGSSGTPFTGTFDGAGFTISDLYINRGNNSGIFGYILVANGTIDNLTIKDMQIECETQGGSVGFLAGFLAGTAGNDFAVTNCNVSGVILNDASGPAGVGGFAGTVSNATFDDCTASVSMTFAGSSGAGGVGGFVGTAGDSDFTTCVAGGSITVSGTPAQDSSRDLGGFVGSVLSSTNFTSCQASTSIFDNMVSSGNSGFTACGGFVGSDDNGAAVYQYCVASGAVTSLNTHRPFCGGFGGELEGSVDECMSTGDVDAPQATSIARVGGFGGRVSSTITECYSSGNVCNTGVGSGTYSIGGFIGYSTSNRTDCYCTGYVNPDGTNVGGFIGERISGTVTTCYWDKETSGTTTAVGSGSSTGITGHTTAEMKLEATFIGFDFVNTWYFSTFTRSPGLSTTVWLSETGDYENFEAGVKDADSFSLVVPTTNTILWLEALEALLLGTAGDEWKIGSNKLQTPISPTNFAVKQQSTYGSADIQALKVNEVILFVDYVKRKVREMTFRGDTEKYLSPDMTSLAEHITETGVVNIAHQKNPDSILWCVLTDGSLISMVYDREQNVIAWSNHPIDGVVQSVCVTPGEDEDDVWISIKRTIDSVDKIYIEKMATRIPQAIEDSYCSDSFKVVTGTSATITGLEHLEGKTVVALVDGVYDGTFTVASGQITLNTTPTAQTIVGLSYAAILQPMRLVSNNQSGSSMGSLTRIHDLKVVFLNTKGAQYGDSTDDLYSFNFDDERLEDAAHITGLFSGDVPVNMEGGFSMENPIIISSDQPFPMTVKAIIAGFERTGR